MSLLKNRKEGKATQELIKITEKDGKQLISARELHEFLEVKSKYADWIKNRIKKYEFVESIDYTTVSKILENGGKEYDHAITTGMAKELSMLLMKVNLLIS